MEDWRINACPIVTLNYAFQSTQSYLSSHDGIEFANIKIWKTLVSLTEDNWIEFDEFLTDEKMVDVQSYIDAIK